MTRSVNFMMVRMWMSMDHGACVVNEDGGGKDVRDRLQKV